MNKLPLYDCCDNFYKLDTAQMSIPEFTVDWYDSNLWLAVCCIIFYPLYWNVIARWEYRTKSLSKVFKSPRLACCMLAATIIALGLYRDWRFLLALKSQPRWLVLQTNIVLWCGHLFTVVGVVLVCSSFWSLGFYGTFLGDYFGILMKSKVCGFPFSVFNHPMFVGSTLTFLGTALVSASQAGILLAMLVAVIFQLAAAYEGPFTDEIYASSADDKDS